MDGAMGTQLIARGLAQGTSAETWNAENPDAVKEVHAAYAEAGCNLITTNTFQGSRTSLANHGMELRCRELNEAGARNAKAAALGSHLSSKNGPSRSSIWTRLMGPGSGVQRRERSEQRQRADAGGIGIVAPSR